MIDSEEPARVMLTYATKLFHEKHLFLEDSKVYYNYTIHSFRIELSTQAILELREARELLVDVVEGFLERINENRIISGELSHRPFTANDLDVYIDFQSYHGLYVDQRYVGWVALCQGTTFIYAFDVKNNQINFWHDRIEPYYKSRDFVKFERIAEAAYRIAHTPPGPRALEAEQYIPLKNYIR